MRSFASNPDNAPEKQAAYKASSLEAMDDAALFKEADMKIWLSAFASNNSASCYHWQCDMTYDEAQRRGKPEIYNNAHKEASRR